LEKISSSPFPDLSRNFFAAVGKHKSKFTPIHCFTSEKGQDKVIKIAVDFFAWYINDFDYAFNRACEHNVRIMAVLKNIKDMNDGFLFFFFFSSSFL
jgi:hypothetical protein